MRLCFFGFLRIEALDSYLESKGRMLIRLLKYFKLSDAKGPQMDRSELVTILAETMLIPSYALQKYIGWTIIDPLTIKGTINYKGTRASGLFYFNNDGDMLRFETLDRYYTDDKGRFQQVKWIAAITLYHLNGINHLRAFLLPGKDQKVTTPISKVKLHLYNSIANLLKNFLLN
jgi:hypothetical protein